MGGFSLCERKNGQNKDKTIVNRNNKSMYHENG